MSVTHQSHKVMKDLHLSYPLLVAIIIFPLNKIYDLKFDEEKMYKYLCTWATVMLVWYIINMKIQIMNYLDIYWWKVTPNLKKYNKCVQKKN